MNSVELLSSPRLHFFDCQPSLVISPVCVSLWLGHQSRMLVCQYATILHLDAAAQIQASLPQTVQLSTTTNPSSSSIQGGGGEEEPRPSNLPPSSPATELTPIFGHPPTNELHPFYNLLVAQLATIIWISEESPSSFAGGDGAGAAGGGSTSYGGTRRPVIVGLALKYRHLSDEAKMGATFHGIAEAVVRLLNAP